MTPALNIHIYPSVFANETRILKIVRSLKHAACFSRIAVIALWKEGLPEHEKLQEGIEVMRVAPVAGGTLGGRFGRIIKVAGWYIGVLLALQGKEIDCVNCHSLPVLPLCVLIKWWKRAVLIYDPHELETETASLRGLRQELLRVLERLLIGFADAVCVVNRSIADWYQARYRVSKVWVVRNVPYRSEAAVERTGLLRRAINLCSPDALLFLYQGLLAPGRGVEMLIDAFARLPPNHHLVFMGYGELSDKIKSAAGAYRNIHYVPAVPPDSLKQYTVDADIGFALIEDVCLSYRFCLPNKLFEYAACGVPSVVSDFPEMGAVIDHYDCGWRLLPAADVVRDFVQGLTRDAIAAKRENTMLVGEEICWQKEEALLVAMYQALGFPGSRAAIHNEG